MNAYEPELRQKWDSIDYKDGGSIQLAVPHALEWYVRYVTENQRSIVAVSDVPAKDITSSQSIEACCGQRKDGKFAVSFKLVDFDQEDVFISMASDIIEYSKNEITHRGALNKVLHRYTQWLKLLEHKRNTLLSPNEQKGLIAELLFLRDVIKSGIKPSDALAGWVGPEGADQDFVYDDGWHEIKSTGISSDSILISSIEQLDASAPGELVVYRIDKCAPAQSGSITLHSTVRSICEMIADMPSVISGFLSKLASAGYIDLQEYDNSYFVVSSKQHYEVNDTFPKIRRADLPQEITGAEYRISLPSLVSWVR